MSLECTGQGKSYVRGRCPDCGVTWQQLGMPQPEAGEKVPWHARRERR